MNMYPNIPAVMMSNSTTSCVSADMISCFPTQPLPDFGCFSRPILNHTTANAPTAAHLQPHDDQDPTSKNKKKKRNLPGNPDPDAEVIALSPRTLVATNRYVCEICNKGFQRDQNLQLHRRGHNLPWKLKQKNSGAKSSDHPLKKRAYVCPETTCVHHHPSRALGDLTGIKKHYSRKHGEKKWKCDKCDKIYAVHSDWKAHSKTCGTREYRCDCGTLFSRKDSFITHRAFCDALAEESARLSAATQALILPPADPFHMMSGGYNVHHPTPAPTAAALLPLSVQNSHIPLDSWDLLSPPLNLNAGSDHHHQNQHQHHSTFIKHESLYSSHDQLPSPALYNRERHLVSSSPMGNLRVNPSYCSLVRLPQMESSAGHVSPTSTMIMSRSADLIMTSPGAMDPWHKNDDHFTRDFLGMNADQCGGGVVNEKMQRRFYL